MLATTSTFFSSFQCTLYDLKKMFVIDYIIVITLIRTFITSSIVCGFGDDDDDDGCGDGVIELIVQPSHKLVNK